MKQKVNRVEIKKLNKNIGIGAYTLAPSFCIPHMGLIITSFQPRTLKI